jgi:hypothetical protein
MKLIAAVVVLLVLVRSLLLPHELAPAGKRRAARAPVAIYSADIRTRRTASKYISCRFLRITR